MGEVRAEYDRWHDERRSTSAVDPRELRQCDWILDLLGAEAGTTLLDVACGQGAFLAVAAARGVEVSGIDLSEVALQVAQGRVPGATLKQGRGEALPLADNSFDYVTCLGSLEHFDDSQAGAAEIRRVLRPEGRAVIYVPNLFFLGHVWFGIRHGIQPSEGEQQFSERFLSSRGRMELLEGAGLRVDSWHPWNDIWASPKVGRATIGLWNLLARFVPRNAAYSFAFVCSVAPPD